MRVWRAGRSRRAQDAARFAAPIAPPLWPPLADPVEEPITPAPVDATAPADAPVAPAHEEHADAPVESPPAPVVAVQLEMQAEFLRLLEVVTSMCDHVIEYIENDRAERRVMVETLTDLGRVITEGATAIVSATAAIPALTAPASEAHAGESAPDDEPFVHGRERVIGGSMPAGPEPIIDLVAPEAPWEPAPATATRTSPKDAAVEVRGRIGDRWVDGFEICEVITTAAGPRYRLRRRLDGVVLPELFEASSIRHVDPAEQHPSEQQIADEPVTDAALDERNGEARERDARVSAPPQYWSRS